MKVKTSIILLISVLFMLLLVACRVKSSGDIPIISENAHSPDNSTTPSATVPLPVQSSSPSQPLPSPEPSEDLYPESAPPVQTNLTFDDAVEICDAWLNEHPDLDFYTIVNWDYASDESPPPTYWLFGEPFYELCVSSDWDGMAGFSHIVLVHEETGELLSVYNTRSDNDMTVAIETMCGWYNGDYVESDKALLSASDAYAIYSDWVNAHSEKLGDFPEYQINSKPSGEYIIFKEEYNYFRSKEDFAYWYNILVHKNTGELLYLMISDGLYPETMITSLDDWYDSIYAQ